MLNKEVTEAVVINGHNKYIGKISIYDILRTNLDHKTKVKGLIKDTHLVLDSKISLVESIEAASNFVGEFIPVKNSNSNEYVGSINESDLFQAYLKLQNQVLHLSLIHI